MNVKIVIKIDLNFDEVVEELRRTTLQSRVSWLLKKLPTVGYLHLLACFRVVVLNLFCSRNGLLKLQKFLLVIGEPLKRGINEYFNLLFLS